MHSTKKSKRTTFFSYYRPYRALLLADLCCAALVGVTALLFPLCVRYIVSNVLEAGLVSAPNTILWIGALMTLLIAAQTGVAYFYDYKGHEMGAKIERDMRLELFTHLQKFSFSFFDQQKTGQLMSRLTNDLLNLAELYHHAPENIVVYGAEFFGASIILFRINPRLALVACALLPVMAVYSFIFYAKLEKAYKESRENIADIAAQTEESLSGIRVVKGFANEAVEVGKFKKQNDRFYNSRSSIYRHEALHFTVMEHLFMQLVTVLVIVAGGIWIASDSLNFADLLAFILYIAYLTGPIPKLAFMVKQYQEGISGYRRFREIVETPPDIQDAANAVPLHNVKGRVTFDAVTFRYNDGQEYVLRDIHLEVAPGETVAIVGRSGVGKTTLCSLIPRFYETNAGDIRIDGQNIKGVTLPSLRQQIGFVQQENFLFAGTVIENILYGRPDASPEEAVEAAKKANAHDFIMELPHGYDTEVGQRGVKLSTGQKQRISIARVFLKNPPILIFDEATSALDYESERIVMEGLRLLAKGRTTFVIAHRLSTIRGADRILLLTSDGLTEQGTHEQLLTQNGAYAQLYNAQEM